MEWKQPQSLSLPLPQPNDDNSSRIIYITAR